jgi:hypothetical protein
LEKEMVNQKTNNMKILFFLSLMIAIGVNVNAQDTKSKADTTQSKLPVGDTSKSIAPMKAIILNAQEYDGFLKLLDQLNLRPTDIQDLKTFFRERSMNINTGINTLPDNVSKLHPKK